MIHPFRMLIALFGLDLGMRSAQKRCVAAGGGGLAVYDDPTEKPAGTASLLFGRGHRPSAEAIAELAESDGWFSVSFIPEYKSSDRAERWIELLAHGLTFDLAGLAPGSSGAIPPKGHQYGFDGDPAPEALEALTLSPGPHLAGGRRSLPIIRTLAGLAARLAGLPEVQAVGWPASRIWCEPGQFRNAVFEWLDGDIFPGLSLVALSPALDGGMHSEGLALFTGQELRLEPPLMQDRIAGTKIALRLLHHLAESGPIIAPQVVKAPDGAPLRLEASPNGLYVRVWPD